MKSFSEILSEAKIPELIDLEINGSKLQNNMMAKASVMGGIKAMDEFKAMNVFSIKGSSFSVVLKDDKVFLKLTKAGQKTIRIRLKDDPNYLDNVIKVFKSSYKKYFK